MGEKKSTRITVLLIILIVVVVIVGAGVGILLATGGLHLFSSDTNEVPVTFMTTPSGASVTIGGVSVGTTPVTVSLQPLSAYDVVVTHDGYDRLEKTITTGSAALSFDWNLVTKPASSVASQNLSPSGTSGDYTSEVTDSNRVIPKTFEWTYNGYTFSTSMDIPESMYQSYRNLSHSNTNLAKYATEEKNRNLVKTIGDSILTETEKLGMSGFDTVMVAVSFVQNLPYVTDNASKGADEYVRYPVETLVDGGGDCEDCSILLASLLREMGYGVVLLRFDGHVAVGVKGGDGMYGTYWTYNGDRYYYVETTEKGWDMGDIPEYFANMDAEVIYIS